MEIQKKAPPLQPKFRIQNLDLVFGANPKSVFADRSSWPRLGELGFREKMAEKTGQFICLQGISFEVHAGEIFGLMGLSGSGKSSLIRCLNGMNGRGDSRTRGQTQGRIEFSPSATKGVISITECSDHALRQLRQNEISMVFQQFGLMPWKTVWQNVEYPLVIKKIPKKDRKETVDEKLRLVGLSQYEHKFPHEISGGMQQRVGLARAFATQAKVLLMDEPFSALDPLNRKALQDELLTLQEKFQKTILFVTHDLAEASRISNRIAILESGRLLQVGTPAEIHDHPACEEVRRFTQVAG